ncbi:MAG: response regulator transcription factor [Rubrobacter sp.]|nr:response regulator transcription factor [Rubrobacter sp.]
MKGNDDLIKVLLVDDHALFREGVAEIFDAEENMQVVGEAENGLEAITLAAKETPDVVILDVEMPVMGAEMAIDQILHASPSSKVLVLTMYDEPRLVRKLLALGAHGYIVKNATREELVAAVHTVYRVENRVVLSVSRNTADRLEGAEKSLLSRRELEVLLLTARAMSNSQIASDLHISEGTVKRHLTNIYAKLGVSSRADAANKALMRGLITFRDLSEPSNK